MSNIFDEALSETENTSENFETLRENYYAALREKALAMQNDANIDLSEANTRFSTALDLRRVGNALVAIIGTGGLGNWQWKILVSMGFRRIALFDDDTVGIENVGSQCHSIFELGNPKVEAIKRAAMEYRGMSMIGIQKRVAVMNDIIDALGETPDIVIGCTDSAEFRKSFGHDLFCQSVGRKPWLYLDYRMSLGDWAAYIIPARHLSNFAYSSLFYNWYKGQALFDPSEALVEACTERAISYTGANVASFTGAVLHWYFTEGRLKFNDADFMLEFAQGGTFSPARFTSFSARDFEFITKTRAAVALEKQVTKAREQRSMLENSILACTPFSGLQDRVRVLNSEILASGGFVPGKILVNLQNSMEIGVTGFGGVYWLGGETRHLPLDALQVSNMLVIEPDPGICASYGSSAKSICCMAAFMACQEGAIARVKYRGTWYFVKIDEDGAEFVLPDNTERFRLNWLEDHIKFGYCVSIDVLDNPSDEIRELFPESPAPEQDYSPTRGDIVSWNDVNYFFLGCDNQLLLGDQAGNVVRVSRKFSGSLKFIGHVNEEIPEPDNYYGFRKIGDTWQINRFVDETDSGVEEEDDDWDDCLEYA